MFQKIAIRSPLYIIISFVITHQTHTLPPQDHPIYCNISVPLAMPLRPPYVYIWLLAMAPQDHPIYCNISVPLATPLRPPYVYIWLLAMAPQDHPIYSVASNSNTFVKSMCNTVAGCHCVLCTKFIE